MVESEVVRSGLVESEVVRSGVVVHEHPCNQLMVGSEELIDLKVNRHLLNHLLDQQQNNDNNFYQGVCFDLFLIQIHHHYTPHLSPFGSHLMS